MNFRAEIEKIFEGKVFDRPLFYSYPGGLRFELSEGDTAIERFLCAIGKASEVCEDIFSTENPPLICIRMRARGSKFVHRQQIREFKNAGIEAPKERAIWLEPVAEADLYDEGEEEWWLNVVFRIPFSHLKNALWCGLSEDVGPIRPQPRCAVYLFDLSQGLVVYPYDRRGMDIVGPNFELLRSLYSKHYGYLLGYDLASMHETFGAPSNHSLQGQP